MSRAASGCPRARARAASDASRCSSLTSSRTSWANPWAASCSSGNSTAAPAAASARALNVWCPAAAVGSGTSTLGFPQAQSSAIVIAPARHTTRSAARYAGAIGSKNPCTTTRPGAPYEARAQAPASAGGPARREAGKRVRLWADGRGAGALPARRDGPGRVAARPDPARRPVRREDPPRGAPRAPRDQGPSQVAPPSAAVDRLDRHEGKPKRMARQHLGLDTAQRADQYPLDLPPRLAQRLRHGERGPEVDPGSATGDKDP